MSTPGASSAPLPARMPAAPPIYKVTKRGHTNSIKINGWTITATKKPILNGREIEAAEKQLGLPLPEMTFGNNSLTLSYSSASSRPSDHTTTSKTFTFDPTQSTENGRKDHEEEQKVRIEWHTIPALACLGVGEDWEERIGGGVQVSMAAQWSKGRSSPSLLSDMPTNVKPVRPHDWTYSTTHTGDVAGPSSFTRSESHSLPLDLLARQDPVLDQILFYEDVSLFEDELHDNGESILNVRIRVMPHCWFILSRLFLRVDAVLFRIYDVRVYHCFGSNEVIREVKGMEASYDEVKAKLESPTDLSPLTDPNFVYAYMTSRKPSLDESGRPKLDHRPTGLARGKPWPGLGEYVEVMRLPPSGIDGVTNGVGQMQL